MTPKTFRVKDKSVGDAQPCYMIAELSCNHDGDFEEARRIIEDSAKAGVDAVKLQSYTPDTMTRDFSAKPSGTIWDDINLYDLYKKAYTPWDWYARLKTVADDCGVHIFSTPFDETSVDFLMEQDVPLFKIASYEAVDVKLLEKVARTGKPVILSNGMTTFLEMQEAVRTLRDNGCDDLCILHCNSGYPADFDEALLANIPVLRQMFDCVIGLSDHTVYTDVETCDVPMAHVTPVEAVRYGAKVVEFHVMLDREKGRALHARNEGGFDWPFSKEPAEVGTMVRMIREYERNGEITYDTELERTTARRTHGVVSFEPTPREVKNMALRPTLYIVQDMKAGDAFIFGAEADKKDTGNFDSIRTGQGGGLHIRYADFIDGKRAARDLNAGEPLSWDMVNTSPETLCSSGRTAPMAQAI